MTFFQKNCIRIHPRTKIAAEDILRGKADEALTLAKNNPVMLHYPIEAKDPSNRRVKGTLLQIAIAAGDVNIGEQELKDEKGQGIAERLSSLMLKEDVEKQLAAWFPLGWKDINDKRMKRYLNALEQFAKSIIKAKMPKIKSKIGMSVQDVEDAQVKCQSIINRLQEALQPDPNEVVTCGYIFDTKIFYLAFKLFESKLRRFGGWETLKTTLFWVNGFGSLQAIASARDAHVIREGIGYVIRNKKFPERTFENPDRGSYYTIKIFGSSCFFTPSSGLGRDYFLGSYGANVSLYVPCDLRHWEPILWKSYDEQKKQSERTMRQLETPAKKSTCVVM